MKPLYPGTGRLCQVALQQRRLTRGRRQLVRYLIEKAIAHYIISCSQLIVHHRDDDSGVEDDVLMPFLQLSWSSGLNKTQV